MTEVKYNPEGGVSVPTEAELRALIEWAAKARKALKKISIKSPALVNELEAANMACEMKIVADMALSACPSGFWGSDEDGPMGS